MSDLDFTTLTNNGELCNTEASTCIQAFGRTNFSSKFRIHTYPPHCAAQRRFCPEYLRNMICLIIEKFSVLAVTGLLFGQGKVGPTNFKLIMMAQVNHVKK
jgi:hypothetical protein